MSFLSRGWGLVSECGMWMVSYSRSCQVPFPEHVGSLPAAREDSGVQVTVSPSDLLTLLLTLTLPPTRVHDFLEAPE